MTRRQDHTHEVVQGIGAGAWRFRYWWQAAAFRYAIRRMASWTSWCVLTEAERSRSVKPLAPTRRARRRWS